MFRSPYVTTYLIEILISFSGLNCMRCVNKIQDSFQPADSVKVNLAQGKAFCSRQKHEEKEVLQSIRNLGFKAYSFGTHQGRVLLKVNKVSETFYTNVSYVHGLY